MSRDVIDATKVAALVVVCFLVGFLAYWWTTRPPEPVVREGKVGAKIDEPAHMDSYLLPIPHTTCSGKPMTCSTSYTFIPMQRWVPERWRLVVVGCPRLKKDAIKEYCDKPSNRKVTVSQADYDRARIGDEWTIA